MTDTTPTGAEQPHPFDPQLAAQIRTYLEAWKADHGLMYVSQAWFHDRTHQRLTVEQLEQLLEQLAWHKQTGEQLAEACARLRQERDEARQQSTGQVWALDHSLWAQMRVFATEELARATAEKYVHDEAVRQPVDHLEWRHVEDDTDNGYDELWGRHAGEMYTSSLIVYAMDVEQAEAGAAPMLGACPTCERRVPLERFDAIASHCIENSHIECTGTGLEPIDHGAPANAELTPEQEAEVAEHEKYQEHEDSAGRNWAEGDFANYLPEDGHGLPFEDGE